MKSESFFKGSSFINESSLYTIRVHILLIFEYNFIINAFLHLSISRFLFHMSLLITNHFKSSFLLVSIPTTSLLTFLQIINQHLQFLSILRLSKFNIFLYFINQFLPFIIVSLFSFLHYLRNYISSSHPKVIKLHILINFPSFFRNLLIFIIKGDFQFSLLFNRVLLLLIRISIHSNFSLNQITISFKILQLLVNRGQ